MLKLLFLLPAAAALSGCAGNSATAPKPAGATPPLNPPSQIIPPPPALSPLRAAVPLSSTSLLNTTPDKVVAVNLPSDLKLEPDSPETEDGPKISGELYMGVGYEKTSGPHLHRLGSGARGTGFIK